MLKEFNAEVQELFLRMMVTNAELLVRITNIFTAANFDRRLRPVAEFMREHSDQYKILPDSTQIKATTGVDIDLVPDYSYFSITSQTFRWRDIYPYGYKDSEGFGVDYPFLNGAHYPFKDINFYQMSPQVRYSGLNMIVQPIIDNCE